MTANINANLDQTAFVAAEDFVWHPSPLAGVERVMLDRVGDEVAVATSLVRYAPKAYFDPHSHALGEEFVVLEGVFSDEHGDYPAGTYIRNPPGTAHKPHSEPGCVIWVKLRQFSEEDLTPLTLYLGADYDAPIETASTQALYRFQNEEVTLVRVPKGERFAFGANYHSRELLLLSGSLTWQQEQTRTFTSWSWIRMDPGQPLRINALTDCVFFSKTRPLYRDALAGDI